MMNERLKKLAGKTIGFGLVLLFWAAMRSDGGLGLWLPLSAAGGALCLTGTGLDFLCSHRGLQWRRARFGTVREAPLPPKAAAMVLSKAG